LDFFEIARRANIRETMAVIQWADSDLLDYVADPRFVDVVITNESLRLQRQLHKSGDIENTYEPGNDTKEMMTAATIIGMSGDPEEGSVQGRINLMKASYFEQEQERMRKMNESTTIIKPAIKRKPDPEPKPDHFRPSRQSTLTEEDGKEVVVEGDSERQAGYGKFDQLEEPGVEDSASNNGNVQEHDDHDDDYAPPILSNFA